MNIASAGVEAGTYLHWGVLQISLANLLVIAVMVVVFALALLVPFPHGRDHHGRADHEPAGREVDSHDGE